MQKSHLNVCVLASGSGSNLQALIDRVQSDKNFPAHITCVIVNKEDAYAYKRAKASGIPAHFISHKNKSKADFETEILAICTKYKIDMICLAGFMRILSADFITAYDGRILNIHPSLLPKHGGEGMYGHHVHEAVLEAGDTESGASVHIVTAGCDEGPVILQKSVPVLSGDSADVLAARVLEIEHELYPLALKKCAEDILSL